MLFMWKQCDSMMDYYRKFIPLVLISLNDWHVLAFQLKNYDENGKEIKGKSRIKCISETPEKCFIIHRERLPEEWLK